MQKLAAVEEAKRLMTEAKGWSLWQWLTEKRRVRAAADAATAALDKAEKKVKADWPDDLKKLYRLMGAHVSVDRGSEALQHVAAQLKKAHDEAYNARMDVEATFDEAERRMSASMAREGAQKAIDSYGLQERAIRKAEAVVRHKVSL
jgi:hypothetical protein